MRFCSFLCAAVLFLLSACGGVRSEMTAEKPSSEDSLAAVPADSSEADSAEIATPAPPKAADLLFDDFIYGFMRSRNFQLQRIVFPLPRTVDGHAAHIAREDWRFDRLYARADVYLMIFSSPRKVSYSKSLKVKHVTVEMLDFDTERVRQYVFDKIDGCWMLTRLDEQDLDSHADGSFYTFYHLFATDDEYQAAHLAPSIAFRTFDDDTFEHIEGTLTPEQWADFRPELPVGRIANINYGQDLVSSDTRVVIVASASAGMNSTLTFERTDGSWMLNQLEN